MIQKLPGFLIRLMVSAVFLSEGIQKFLFPETLGTARFLKLGIPLPGLAAYGVATLELAGAILILLGKKVRPAAFPLLLVMAGAIYYTKIPYFESEGFWKTAHEARTDFCMVCGLLYLLISPAA